VHDKKLIQQIATNSFNISPPRTFGARPYHNHKVGGGIFEVHAVPVGTDPFAYGSKIAERDRRIGNGVLIYEVLSPFGEIFVPCSSPDRWFDLSMRHGKT
jgi:hypothetical protein